MRRLLAPSVALLLLLSGSACSDDDADAGGERPGEDASGGEDLSIQARSTVELLDPGQEPRQVLRLRPPADCEQRVTQRQQATQEVVGGTLDGTAIPADELAGTSDQRSSSGNEFDITYRCEALDAERIAVVSRFDDVRTVGTTATPEAKRVLEGFVGAEGRVVYDPRGNILEADAPDVRIDEEAVGPVVADAMEQMVESLGTAIEQSANPFPDEPVGVGGVWRVTAEVTVLGLEATAVTEYSVTRIEGDVVEANLTISYDMPGGEITLPGLPGSTGAELLDGSLLGAGTSTWELDGVVPYFEQRLDGTFTMRIEQGGRTVELTMRQHQENSLEPR